MVLMIAGKGLAVRVVVGVGIVARRGSSGFLAGPVHGIVVHVQAAVVMWQVMLRVVILRH
jgi:hypothetical protein